MKNLFIITVVAGLGYIGYVTWVQHQKAEEIVTAPAQPTPALAALSTPPPVSVSPPVAVATPVKHIAPDGVYFLLERISVTTDSGVIGVVPGTKVRLEKDNGATLAVTDGTNHFDVNPTQVTNDLDVVANFSKAQAAQDAALVAWTQQQKRAGATADQQHIQQLEASNKEQEKGATLNALQNQLASLSQQEANLRTQIANDNYARSTSHAAIRSAIPTGAETSVSRQQLSQVLRDEANIKNQISLLQR